MLLTLSHERDPKAHVVCMRLREHYGDLVAGRRLPPLDQLVLTILSQNTADINAERAYGQLRETYASWDELLDSQEEDIGEVIRPSGAFRVKAHRIRTALREIRARVGSLNLSMLGDMPLDEAKAWLTSLHGVGPKTAAIVLLFSFGRPALPVDTHVWRVSRRLGMIPNGTTRERAHILLEELLDTDCIYAFNHNMVRHGREICRARNPLCGECFLADLCEYHTNKQRPHQR